uniref:Translocation associated membrane protein 2 n=1 Tax=Eptatretus burgeri TaxID=7764 RepID=A0A8C4Q707_EPTBU
MALRRKGRSPAFFSHEFFIQNHVDMMSVLIACFLLAFMFETTANGALMFLTVQHNITIPPEEEGEESMTVYEYGARDCATVFFYTTVAIVLHGMVQEHILDRINRRLHLSKAKHGKFNESGQLVIFFLLLFLGGVYILAFVRHPLQYQHKSFVAKLMYFIDPLLRLKLTALSLYLQKRQKFPTCSVILTRLGFILFVVHYFVELIFHVCRIFFLIDEDYQRGFDVWAVLFVLGRLMTLTMSVLTIGFGLARSDNRRLDIATGNFNILPIRVCCLAVVCLGQAWMMWKFINFQLRRWREYILWHANKKKQLAPRPKRELGM